MEITDSLLKRFWEKVVRRGPDECWGWVGTRNNNYGRIMHQGMNVYAHRLSWIIHNGPIPNDVCVLHRCDNPPCANPSHLFLGTYQDNVNDMMQKGRHRYVAVRGEDIGNSKLTHIEAMEILSRYTGKRGEQSELAREYGVSQAQVWRIVNNLSWEHINGNRS